MARTFSGASLMSTPDITSLRPANVTLTCWVKGSAQGNFKYIISKTLLANEHASYAFATDAGGDVRFFIGIGTSPGNQNNSAFVASANVFNGAWHHLAGTYDGANIRIYLDGAQVGADTAETTALAYNTNSLYLGCFDGSQLFYSGSMQDVSVHNVALTAAEIAGMAKGISPNQFRGCIEHWPLIGRYSPEPGTMLGLKQTAGGSGLGTADHRAMFYRIGASFGVEVASGASSVNLTPAVMTHTAVAVDPQPQPVTISLTPAVMTLSAVAAVVQSAVNLTPASMTMSAVSVSPVPQPVTINLTPAVITTAGVAVTPVPQPVTVNLTAATLSLGAVAVSPQPGQVTVALTPAVLNFSAPAVAPGGLVDLVSAVVSLTAVAVTPVPQPVTIALTPAVMSLVGVGTNPVAQPVNVSLSPVSVALTAVSVTPVPQQVTMSLTAAVMTFNAPAIAVNGAVNLVPALIALQGVAVTPVPGPVTINLVAASVAIVAQPVSPVPVAVVVNAVAATLTLSARSVIATPGQATMALTAAVFTITAPRVTFGRIADVRPPDVTVSMWRRTITASLGRPVVRSTLIRKEVT